MAETFVKQENLSTESNSEYIEWMLMYCNVRRKAMLQGHITLSEMKNASNLKTEYADALLSYWTKLTRKNKSQGADEKSTVSLCHK